MNKKKTLCRRRHRVPSNNGLLLSPTIGEHPSRGSEGSNTSSIHHQPRRRRDCTGNIFFVPPGPQRALGTTSSCPQRYSSLRMTIDSARLARIYRPRRSALLTMEERSRLVFEQVSDQVRSDQIMSGQIKITSNQVRSNQVRSDQVKSGQITSDQIRSGQVKSGQVKSGQIRSDQTRSGQIRSDQKREEKTRKEKQVSMFLRKTGSTRSNRGRRIYTACPPRKEPPSTLANESRPLRRVATPTRRASTRPSSSIDCACA